MNGLNRGERDGRRRPGAPLAARSARGTPSSTSSSRGAVLPWGRLASILCEINVSFT
jgi:hypothetical protein